MRQFLSYLLLVGLALAPGCVTSREYRPAGHGFGFLGRGHDGSVRRWALVYGEPGIRAAQAVQVWPDIRDPAAFATNGELALCVGTVRVDCHCGWLFTRLRVLDGRLVAGRRDGTARDITIAALHFLCDRDSRHAVISDPQQAMVLAVTPSADGATVRFHVQGAREFESRLSWAEVRQLLDTP